MSRKRKKKKDLFLKRVIFTVLTIVVLLVAADRILAFLHVYEPEVEVEAVYYDPEETARIAAEQLRAQREAFIEELSSYAVEIGQENDVLPSLILAQAALESNFGTSLLASQYFNLFGVKSFGATPFVTMETYEFIDGEWQTYDAEFRVYDSWRSSMLGLVTLFRNGVTWDPTLYHGVFAARNYEEAARAVQAAGYATDPYYADSLIALIREFNLNRYDTSVSFIP